MIIVELIFGPEDMFHEIIEEFKDFAYFKEVPLWYVKGFVIMGRQICIYAKAR